MMMMTRDSCAVVCRARIRGRAVRETATRSVSIDVRARAPSSRIYSFVCSVVARDSLRGVGTEEGGARGARVRSRVRCAVAAGHRFDSIRAREGRERSRRGRTIEGREEKKEEGARCVGVDGGGRARDGDATGARGDRGDEARRRRRGGRFKRREGCLLYTSLSPRDRQKSRMPSSA